MAGKENPNNTTADLSSSKFSPGIRRSKHNMLANFYGLSEMTEKVTVTDPCDIDGSNFNPDSFLNKLLRECSLTELMDKETEMVRHIRSLDSDMQTLVYENYNKFINATDTIRKMKNDFKKMEYEMDQLASNMTAITEFSGKISSTLQDRRQQITRLTGIHTLLKKLQFLFELPTRLKKCIELKAYNQAVRYYMKSRKLLQDYHHMSSFQGIHQDCTAIVNDLKELLRAQFKNIDSSPKQLAECVDLLLQLNEPAEDLCQEFLTHAQLKIDENLNELEKQIILKAPNKFEDNLEQHAEVIVQTPMDILEFVDFGCNTFLGNICLVIASYNDMFLNRQQNSNELETIAMKKLSQFVNNLMDKYFTLVERRILLEKETGDNTILVRALDRFHRRLQTMNKLLPDTDFSRSGIQIISKAAKDRVLYYFNSFKQQFSDCLTDIRQNLAAPVLSNIKQDKNPTNLVDLLQSTHTALVDAIKSVLSNLQAFIVQDITFSTKSFFRGSFCSHDVRENFVVASIQHITKTCGGFCESSSDKNSVPPPLLLILSRLCVNLESNTINYLITLTDEQFFVETSSKTTEVGSLSRESKNMAQQLLNHYVRVQGLTISQMLRKSVETRDWLNTIEPRNVRAVMKRVVEDITAIDAQVGQLFEEGIRKDSGSDSTKRSFGYSASRQNPRSTWSYAPSTIDNSLLSNIQKLFSEKIEIFSPVEFSKVSVLTGIIKISLKTFLECVRLRTFGKYGLQQIQVDTHYLQLYLWRFVSDENLVHCLLDEIVVSTLHRCINPSTMESSVVELICERG